MTTPQYQVIRTELESRITSGELAPGDKLPTEAELQAQYGVSRSVAQRVLNELANAGLVVRRARRGTHVSNGARQINVMRSVDPRIGANDMPGHMQLISAETVTAESAAVVLPGLEPTAPVNQMVRVRRTSPEAPPIAVEIAAIPFALTPQILQQKSLDSLKVRSYLAEVGISISRSRMYFDPMLLERDIAKLLETDPGVPTLRRRRLMWQPNGQIAESTAYYLRPGEVEFFIEYADRESLTPGVEDWLT
ncbi:MAG: GntR family transcriptional regulator [Agrococcus casei]|uniref:GntR family transcriptional regulator n=1 Tax=Agrococcus casei TaxID=343512 RepID=UPI003F935118